MSSLAKYIANISGKLKEVYAIVTSAGVANAYNIVQTDSTGRLDVSVMPVGLGPEVVNAVAYEALSAGHFVNLFLSGGVLQARKADASVNSKFATGFVLAGYSPADPCVVYQISQSNTQLSALVIGTEYYLSTTPGGITATAPSGNTQIVQRLGVANSTTSIVFDGCSYFEVTV